MHVSTQVRHVKNGGRMSSEQRVINKGVNCAAHVVELAKLAKATKVGGGRSMR